MDRSLKFQNTVDLARRALIADAVGGGSPGDYLNWDAAYAHKVIEDAISGIIQCNGAGAYSSLTLTDTSSIDFTYAGGALSAVVLPAGVNHNALANLAIGDVHTQYALLAGRAGGQVIKGDTASGGNLTLNSTAHATKGKIYLGVSSYYDEAAKVLAIGTTTPAAGIACAIIGGILGTDGTRAGDPTAESTTGLHWSFNAQSMASNIYGIGLGALRGSKYDMYFKTGSTNGGGYRWYIGDTEYMTMDKAGQVGIGTTSPATGVKLAVIGGMFGTDGSRAAAPSTSASAGMHWTFNATSVATNAYGIGLGEARSSKYDMWFQTGNVNGGGYRFYFGGTSELVTFSYQGKVGIGGVIAPSGLLHIATSTTAAGLIYFDQASADTDSFDLNFRKSRGTIASPTVVTTGDELGTISFWGYSGAGGFVQGAGFKFFSEGTIASTRIPGRVECWTATDATPSVYTRRWYTDSAGQTSFLFDTAHLSDSVKAWFGAGKDMSIWYDGTNGNVKTSDVAPSDLHIQCGTQKTIVLDTVVYDDLWPTSTDPGSGAAAPAYTAYNGNLKGWEFVGTGVLVKELQAKWQFSHKYKEGTDCVPHIHLAVPNDGTGGDIKMYFEYTWTNIDGTIGGTATISGTLTIAASAGLLHKKLIFNSAAISGSGKTISSIISARIYRDPADVADTFGSSVWLKSMDIHYQIDTMGSRQTMVK